LLLAFAKEASLQFFQKISLTFTLKFKGVYKVRLCRKKSSYMRQKSAKKRKKTIYKFKSSFISLYVFVNLAITLGLLLVLYFIYLWAGAG